MCGIAGAVWTNTAAPLEYEVLRRMTEVLAHRGPDDDGHYTNELAEQSLPGAAGVALGFRRLSIIDVEGGHQPMSNEDGSIWVVFNGEIYNYRELHRRLQAAGHKFRTTSDTETLVHLYEDEGVRFLEHLEGMFALALWDGRKRQLILARDRMGEKPLVYRVEPGRLLFASELKSLLEVPGVPRDIDPVAVDQYLTYQYVPHPNTIFRGIRKLPPAHYAIYRDGNLQVAPYWNPDFSLQIERPDDEYIEDLRARLTASVERRLRSDVPLGAFLSGGLDSSIICAIAQRLLSEPIKTFSIGFPVKEYDETHYARAVAERLGTDHREFRVEPDAMSILPKLIWHYDEPMADSSAIPTYYISQKTREHVTVALTGDGGDELFAGYNRYPGVRLAGIIDRVPNPLHWLLGGKWWQKVPASAAGGSKIRQWKRFAEGLSESPQRRYFNWMSIFNDARRREIYSDGFLSTLPDVDPFEFLESAFARSAGRDAVTQASLTDLVTYLPCDLMTKVDIASMAHALECRTPFLDYHVVELAAAMPLRLKMRGRRTVLGKWILLKTFGHDLPPELWNRPKWGFAIPLAEWFRHELRDFARDVLLDSGTMSRSYFRPEAVRKMLDDHIAGRFNHSLRLWSLLVFELWQRQWTDQHATAGA